MVFNQLNKCDIFGKQVILNYNSSGSIKTSLGGFISLGTITVICLFFWNTLLDFLNKNHVILLQSEQFSNNPSLLELNTNDFMFAVQIQQTNFVENPYYNITIEQKSYTLLSNGTRLQNTTYLDMEPCTKSHWSMIDKERINSTFDSLGLSDYLCVKKNQTVYIQGQYESPVYQFLKFSVTKCVNVTGPQFYSWHPVCQTELSTQKFANSTVRMQFQMSNFIFNPTEPKNLVDCIISSDLFFQIQPDSMYTTADIFFNQVNIETDNSLFFTKDISEQTYAVQQYGDFRSQYTQYIKGTSKPYATFYFNRSRFTYYYYRSYMKLQDMLSQLGGFVNSMIAIAAIVVGFYNTNYYILELANKLYDYDIQEQGEFYPIHKLSSGIQQQQPSGDLANKYTQERSFQMNFSQQPKQNIFQGKQIYFFRNKNNFAEGTGNSKNNELQSFNDMIQDQSKRDTLNINNTEQNYSKQQEIQNTDEKQKLNNQDQLTLNTQTFFNEQINQKLVNNSKSNLLIHQNLDQNLKKEYAKQAYNSDKQDKLAAIKEQEMEGINSNKRLDTSQKLTNRQQNQKQSLKDYYFDQNEDLIIFSNKSLYDEIDQIENNSPQQNIQQEVEKDKQEILSLNRLEIEEVEKQKQQCEQQLTQNINYQTFQKIDSQIHQETPSQQPSPKTKKKFTSLDSKLEEIEQNQHLKNSKEKSSTRQSEQKIEVENQNKSDIDGNYDDEKLSKQSKQIILSDINVENLDVSQNQVRQTQQTKNMQDCQKSNASSKESQSQANLKIQKNYDCIKNTFPINKGIDKFLEQVDQSQNNQINDNQFQHDVRFLTISPQNCASAFKLNSDTEYNEGQNKYDNQSPPFHQIYNFNLEKESNQNNQLLSPLFKQESYQKCSQKEDDFIIKLSNQAQNANFELNNNLQKQQNNQQSQQNSKQQSKEELIPQADYQQQYYQQSYPYQYQQKNPSLFKLAISNQTIPIQSQQCTNTNAQQILSPTKSFDGNSFIEQNQNKSVNQADLKKGLIQQELLKMNQRRQKISYSLKYIIYKLSCQKLYKTKQNLMVDKAQGLIASNLDIIKILDKIQEIDRIKCLLLDYEQRILFSYFPKPIVQMKNDDQIKIFDSHGENVYKQYAENLHTEVNVVKTIVKAKNKLKQKVDDKNEIKKIIDQSSLENNVNNFDRTYGINEYEQIYKAYRKVSSKPVKTHTDIILIELMGQELQKIFSQLDDQKTVKKKGLFGHTQSSYISNTPRPKNDSINRSQNFQEPKNQTNQKNPQNSKFSLMAKNLTDSQIK